MDTRWSSSLADKNLRAPTPMTYSEANLAKLLEYGKMAPSRLYEAVAGVLGLEFYSEQDGHSPPIYTICSNTFVLDITESTCSLIFVDESRNAEFGVVQKYLNAYLGSPLIFFHLLKFFVSCVDLTQADCGAPPDDASMVQRDLQEYKTICSCLFGGAYCLGHKIGRIPRGYNIFTHRNEDNLYNPIIYKDAADCGRMDGGPCISRNLSDYFTLDSYTVNTPEAFSEPSQFHYSSGKLRVAGGDVFMDGERCKIASFVFKKGRTLADAIDVSNKIRGKRGL